MQHSIGRYLTHESPPVLYHEICHWWSHVQFCCDWAVLSSGIRLRRPGLICSLPLRWVLPAALPLLTRLRWSVSARGDTLSRVDDHGRHRVFHIGRDGHEVLREWLLLPHRRAALAPASVRHVLYTETHRAWPRVLT